MTNMLNVALIPYPTPFLSFLHIIPPPHFSKSLFKSRVAYPSGAGVGPLGLGFVWGGGVVGRELSPISCLPSPSPASLVVRTASSVSGHTGVGPLGRGRVGSGDAVMGSVAWGCGRWRVRDGLVVVVVLVRWALAASLSVGVGVGLDGIIFVGGLFCGMRLEWVGG
jgi:hypothetical protein